MRKWHRWISVVVILFMTTIAATGVMLTSEMWLERIHANERCAALGLTLVSAPRDPNVATPAQRACQMHGSALHEMLVRVHTGNMFGNIGRTFSLVSGLGLLFFCVSGMWMYVQMFRRRFVLGRRSMFWN